MATHSSVLAWRIPGTREPGGLPSMGSHRVGHDWSDLAAAAEPLTHTQTQRKRKERKSKKLFIPLEKMSKGNRIFVRVMVITKGIYLTKLLK